MSELLMVIKDSRLILIALAAIAGTLGDAFFNEAAKNGQIKWILVGFVFWNLTSFLFFLVLKHQLLNWSVIALVLLNMMFALLLSYYYFGEPFSQRTVAGIIFAIIAIVLMGI